ncbi:MAG: DUF4129 domain-containing protein [Candidatus Sumerlaeota bacterium]|nr:DUF4129 domain-containing protein [Candidatus Sumerlaeota bacterium]
MSEPDERLWTPTPYHTALYALLFLWVSLNGALCLWLFSRVGPTKAMAIPLVGFAVVFGWAYAGKAALVEIHGAMGYREKLLLFVATVAFLGLPKVLDPEADGTLSLVALNIPLAAMACKKAHFQRLYCVNLLLTVCIARGAPGSPFWVWALEASLLCAIFSADYLAFQVEEFPEAGVAGLRLAALSALLYLAVGVGALALAWAILPPLRPAAFSLWPERWLEGPHLTPSETPVRAKDLWVYYGSLLVALALSYVALRWALGRLRRRKTASIELSQDERVMVRRAPRLVERREPAFDLSTPRGRIVYAYNLFLRRLAERGLGKPPSATPGEYAVQLKAGSTLPNKTVDETTDVFEAAHYGEGDFTDAQAEAYRETLDRVAKDAAAFQGENPAPNS